MGKYNYEYSEKLRDPRWQKKRLKIMERAGFKCEACGDEEETLQIHHLIYVKGGEPWDSPDEHLECLCATCHECRETWNAFWDGRSLHPTAFCMHFIERFQPSFSGKVKFVNYPFMLAMAKDVTKQAVKDTPKNPWFYQI